MNKVVVITGGTSGIGLETAKALAAQGCTVYELSRRDKGIAQGVKHITADVTDDKQVDAAVKQIVAEAGRIDVLINNAGTNFAAPLPEFPDEKWKTVVDVQLEAVHYLSRLVAPVMIKQGGGKIINVASALSFSADPNATAYTVAKHGIIGMTRSYAAELGKYNISCNAIAPGFFETKLTSAIRELNPALYEKVCDRATFSPAGRGWGDAFDLMGTIVFLSSSASDYINGEVIVVDGGFKATMA